MVIGVIIWYLFLQSGIHSTISGVILAFVIPAKPRLNVGKYIEKIRHTIADFPAMQSESIVLTNEQIAKLKEVESASDRVISPLQSLEDNLHGTVNYLILPLFAFVNAGVVFSGGGELVGAVSIAVAAGLLLGKFIGIYFFTWLAIKIRLTPMPLGMTWKNLSGVALLGGIGFTVSLFIANLSFWGRLSCIIESGQIWCIDRNRTFRLTGICRTSDFAFNLSIHRLHHLSEEFSCFLHVAIVQLGGVFVR